MGSDAPQYDALISGACHETTPRPVGGAMAGCSVACVAVFKGYAGGRPAQGMMQTRMVMTRLWMGRIVFIVGALFVASGVVAAQSQDANNSNGSVLERVRPLAEQGNPNAQYNLGVIYDRGYGVERDYAKARAWYEKAAAQGNASAAHNLGMMYKKGHGVSVDYQQAADWFKQAAELGEPAAQNNLGVMYAEGMGVEKNPALAAIWMARAAQAGNKAAIDNLPVVAEALPEARIGGNDVNIRAEPGTSADVLTQLDAGVEVVVLQQRDGWSRILSPSDYTLGWVASSLLDGVVQLAADSNATPVAAGDEASAQPEGGDDEGLLAEVRAEAAAAVSSGPAEPAAAETTTADAVQGAEATPRDEAPDQAAVANADAATAEGSTAHGASLVEQSSPGVNTVGVDTVNVREQPSRQAEVLFQVHRGDRVTILRTHNGWDYVEAGDGRQGWLADYLLVD